MKKLTHNKELTKFTYQTEKRLKYYDEVIEIYKKTATFWPHSVANCRKIINFATFEGQNVAKYITIFADKNVDEWKMLNLHSSLL